MTRRTGRRVRARRGEGTRPRRRADGRWVGVLDLGWSDGRRRRVYYYGSTEAECADKLEEGRRKYRIGLDVTSDRVTLEAYLTGWLDDVRADLRPSTFTSYKMIVEKRIIPKIGTVQLGQLRASTVNRLMRDLAAAGLSGRSIQYTRAVLRRALGMAVRQRLLERNEAALSSAPKVTRHEIVPFSSEQARTLIDHVSGDRLGALYLLALLTGARQGELLGLCWGDVDLKAGTLHIRHALARVDGTLELTEPKTARSRRIIELPAMAAAALRDHRVRQLEERLAAGPAWVGDPRDFVFTSVVGTPLDGTNVLHRFQLTLAAAGLPRRRFHDLRHTAATLLIEDGASPVQVAQLLGHSSISLTLGTYSHVTRKLARDTASRMDSILASGT